MSDVKEESLIKQYLTLFPNMSNLSLAKKIYIEHPLQFNNAESIRNIIRYHKGSHGKHSLKYVKDERFLNEDKKQLKYNLPKSIKQVYEPYKIITNKALIFADLQIPFQDNNAISVMLDYMIPRNPDSIIIDGDLMDCFMLSDFCKEPNITTFKEERKATKDFLIELKRLFPKATIYYKFGNHEKRFEDYLKKKAPEIFGEEEFRLVVLLDLYNLGIKYIEEDRYLLINGELKIIHSHEYKNAIQSPANPARTLFLRTKSNTVGAHHHQTSQHSESKLGGDIISCWSLGCLCGLNPKWMPLNKWNHGFAEYIKDEDKFWHVQNKMIIKDRVI